MAQPSSSRLYVRASIERRIHSVLSVFCLLSHGQENLQAWLLQKQYLEGKDQYLVRWGDESQILWNSVHPELEVGKSVCYLIDNSFMMR